MKNKPREPQPENRREATKPRVGFAASADKLFKQLTAKEQRGLKAKLFEVAKNHSLAKPLWDSLKGHSRVTYGRLRCVVRLAEGLAVVLVVYVGLRKEASEEDVYAAAQKVLQRERPDLEQLLARLVRSLAEENKIPKKTKKSAEG